MVNLHNQLRLLKDSLAARDGRLAEIFSTCEVGVCLIGADGAFERLSPAWEECLGHSVASMVGRPVVDFLHPGDRRPTEAAISRLSREQTVQFPTRFRQSDGNYRTLQWTASRAGTNGAVCAFVLAGVDGRVARERAVPPPKESNGGSSAPGASPGELYRTVVQTSPDAIIVTDLTGQIQVINEQAAVQWGLDNAQELVGQNAFDYVAPTEEARSVEDARLLLETGGLRNVEYEIVRGDESRISVEVNAAVIKDESGVPTGFVANVRDITERKLAAAALRESEERYRILYRDNPSMYFTVDANGLVLSVNQFGAAQLGYEAEELVGKPVLDVFVDADRASVLEQLALCLGNPGEVYTWEFRKRRSNGDVIWVKEVARTTMGATGEPIVLIVCEDITDSKRAEELRRKTEEALRVSEERYRILYQDNPSMYFTVDAYGKVLSVNDFGASQLGYTAEELVGTAVSEIFHPQDKKAVAKQLAACVAARGEMRHWEFRKVRKDGDVMWVKETARATSDANSETIVLIVCEDITERKEMEEELQRAREALERKVERKMKRGRAYGLTFREMTVLHLVTKGYSDRDIATQLGISPLTVSKHVANVLGKMASATRSEASARAVRESIVD
jgi:PAS domain S-box-containing protein